MTLAEAIRLGSMTSKQITGGVFEEGGGRCALSAAADACGISPSCGNNLYGEKVNITPYVQLEQRFPILGKKVKYPFELPPIMNPLQTVEVVITTMNDTYGWSRERIAAWVETIEQAEPTQKHELVVMR